MYSAKSVARVGMMLITVFLVSQKVKLNYDMLEIMKFVYDFNQSEAA